MRRAFPRFIAPVLAVLAASSSFAQQPPAEPFPEFGEVIDVRVVNVEVAVTDPQGNRVTDLKPGDLRLKVDGKEVPVSFFTEVREGQAVSQPGQAEAGPAAGASPGPVGTNYLVFIDEYFSTPQHRNLVLKALKNDLARLGPHDRMAVVAFDGARLATLSGWSGSAGDLTKAFDQAQARPARGLDRIAERRSFRESERISTVATDPETLSSTPAPRNPVLESALSMGLEPRERAFGDTLVRQIDGVITAAVSAMRASASPPGRKVMLLLSGGWPFSVQSFLTGRAPISTTRELPEGEELFRPLTSTANLLGYTLYPVDVPGIETPTADADTETTAGIDSLREQEIHGALQFIARETGGEAALNTSRDAAFQNAQSDTRSYYWLGFTPSWQRDNKRHKVEVEALRPGLKVRARNSFLDLSREAEVAMKLESALLFGRFPGSAPMPIRLGAPVRSKKGEMELPVTLGLPVNTMTVVQSNGKYGIRLELRVAAADENGNRSDIPAIPLHLTSDKAPTPGNFVRYDTRLKLRGTARHLVLALYDPLSGNIATAEADLTRLPEEQTKR